MSEVGQLAICPSGKLLAAGRRDGAIAFWDAATGTSKGVFKDKSGTYVYSIAFSPCGGFLAFARIGYPNLGILDLAGGEPFRIVKKVEGYQAGMAVAFTPDGENLASGGDNGNPTIKLWDVRTAREIQTLVSHRDNVYCIAFSSDGRYMASASADGTIGVWRRGLTK